VIAPLFLNFLVSKLNPYYCFYGLTKKKKKKTTKQKKCWGGILINQKTKPNILINVFCDIYQDTGYSFSQDSPVGEGEAVRMHSTLSQV
jgi:hypothetical protein